MQLKIDEFKSEKIDVNLFNEYVEWLERINKIHITFRKIELKKINRNSKS